MKWLGKLLGKKKTYPKESQFKLCIINEDSDLVAEVLGITEQRAHEIGKLALKSYDSHSKKTDSLQELLNDCTHINEVVFAFECFNKIEKLKAEKYSVLSFMQKLFGDE
jgi:hypothetical protein